MNDPALAVALATSPTAAFNDLRERPRFVFPLVLVIVASIGILFWYYSVVDIDWLKDAMFSNNPDIQKLPDDQRVKALGMFTRTTLLWGSVIGALFAVPFFLLLQTIYLLVAAKITKLPQGFVHWFALSCWASLPIVLNSVVAAILILLRDNAQVGVGVMQALSLNELVFHRPMGSPGYSMISSLGIPSFLSWLLMIIGVHTWSQRSWLFSAVYILLPVVVIYGIVAAFAFR